MTSLTKKIDITISSSVFTVVIIGLYTTYLTYMLIYDERTWKVPKRELLLALTLLIIVAIRIFSGGYSSKSLLFFPVYTAVILLTNLFIVPQAVSSDILFGTISRITAIFALLAIPIWFFAPIDVGVIKLIRWDDSFLQISSIFANPNALAKFAMVGFFGALLEYNRYQTNVARVLLLITTIVVLLSYSRAVIVGIVIAMIVYFIQTRISSSAAILCVSGLFAGLFCFLTIIYFGWIPFVLNDIHFSGRLIIWEGVVNSLKGEKFWIGYGFMPASETIDPYLPERWHNHGPHNAYYRWWLRGGIVTVITFLLLFWGTIFRHYQAPQTNPAIGALGVAWAIVFLFDASLLIGAGIFPVLISLSLGYLIMDTANIDSTAPDVQS
ncbi:O-antigen ligase family protein [Natrinema zhouii]|uniref:O-antigen ligase family protein n=1 Tax=Natrinema zhouii TaxID=1710539 RepID=A0A7D6CSF6_9EURY|nr:O-antigen ligase family protein [Natrinema zhouii]QLK26811.1 O-antigen ligase family protein [Natrinema zhouii]